MLTCSIIIFLSLLLLGRCSRVVVHGVCEVALVPYVVGAVDAVDAVTVMCALLFVLDVSILRVCDGDGNASVGGVVAVSAGH